MFDEIKEEKKVCIKRKEYAVMKRVIKAEDCCFHGSVLLRRFLQWIQ